MPAPTTAPVKLIPKKYTLRGTMKVEEVEDLFETVWKNKTTLTTSINSLLTRLAAGDIGARGAHGDVQFNRNGLLWGESKLNWDYDAKVLNLRGDLTGLISIDPTDDNYQDIVFGARVDDSGDYNTVLDNFGYLWAQPGSDRLGVELVHGETPGSAATFNKGVGYMIITPDGASNPRTFNVYQYGGLGTGASATGMGVLVDNNDEGSGAAGWYGARDKSGNSRYFWPDANGVWRFHTARPTEDNTTVSDTVSPGSSLAADNGYFANRVGIQTESPTEPLHIRTNTTTSAGIVRLDMYDSSAAAGGNIFMRHARGSIGSESAIQANDVLGGLFGSGWHSGGAFSTNNVAAIRMVASENFTNTNQGTYIDFATTSGGGVTRTVKWSITDIGHLVSNNGTEQIRWGQTSSFPALKRSGTQLQVRLGDDSAYSSFRASSFGAGADGDGSSLVNVAGGLNTAPRVKVTNETATQFSSTGLTMRNVEVASGHEEWHFTAQKDASGSATGTSSFIIRRRNATQSEATTHFNIDGSGNIQLNAGFTAGSGASLQGNVCIRTATTPGTALWMGATGGIGWNGRARLYSPADGQFVLLNTAENDFSRLQFGGTTSSFPALKRSSTTLQVRLADDSAFSPFQSSIYSLGTTPASVGSIRMTNAETIAWRNATNSGNVIALVVSASDNVVVGPDTNTDLAFRSNNTVQWRVVSTGELRAEAGTQTIQWGSTSSFPMLKRNSAELQVRLADDSGYANIDANVYKTGGTSGVSGTFTTADAKTVTVTNGIVTSIV